MALGRTMAVLAVWISLMGCSNSDISSFDSDNWNGKGTKRWGVLLFSSCSTRLVG